LINRDSYESKRIRLEDGFWEGEENETTRN
jgi:hypothetical protein